MKKKSTLIMKFLKLYQRPIRTIVWAILLATAFLGWTYGLIPYKKNPTLEYIIIGMFTDMGVYAGLRTQEKIAQMKQNNNEE